MGRRPDAEMQAVIDAIKERVETQETKQVLTISANEIAREFDVSPNTVTTILRMMKLKYDGVYWYWDEK
jgi:DNA-binding CsgD family transcriptional regulator